MRAALPIARLAAHESLLGYAALGAAVGAVAAAAALSAPIPSAAERARIALGYGLGAAEVFAVAAAGLAAAIGLARDLALGSAASVLVRPIGRGAYALGRFAGAAAIGAAVAVATAGAAAAAIAFSEGPAGLASVAPRTELTAPGGRFSLATGESQGWTFEPPPEIAASGATLRVRPRYQMVDGIPGIVEMRVRPFAGGRELAPLDLTIPTVAPGDVPLPSSATAAARVRLVFEPVTPGAVLGLDGHGLALRGPPRSLALALLSAAFGIALEAAFVAALATLGATFLSDWVACFLAFGLGLAARVPDLLHVFAREVAAGATHAHGLAAPAAPPGPLLLLVQRALDALAAILPDLGTLDLSAALEAGRAISPGEVLRALAVPLPYVAGALVLAALVLRRRELGLGAAGGGGA